jgi:ribosomal protein L7/L12
MENEMLIKPNKVFSDLVSRRVRQYERDQWMGISRMVAFAMEYLRANPSHRIQAIKVVRETYSLALIEAHLVVTTAAQRLSER